MSTEPLEHVTTYQRAQENIGREHATVANARRLLRHPQPMLGRQRLGHIAVQLQDMHQICRKVLSIGQRLRLLARQARLGAAIGNSSFDVG